MLALFGDAPQRLALKHARTIEAVMRSLRALLGQFARLAADAERACLLGAQQLPAAELEWLHDVARGLAREAAAKRQVLDALDLGADAQADGSVDALVQAWATQHYRVAIGPAPGEQ